VPAALSSGPKGSDGEDVVTRAPVTPATRFNIGTAASAVTASVAPLGLAIPALTRWQVESWASREPEDDFPPFTLIRHVIFRPIGLAPDQPLPGSRATFTSQVR
jgi:hypothetical protein